MRGMILEAAPSAVIRPAEGQEFITLDVPLEALTLQVAGPHQPLGRLISLVAQGLVLVRQVLRPGDKSLGRGPITTA